MAQVSAPYPCHCCCSRNGVGRTTFHVPPHQVSEIAHPPLERFQIGWIYTLAIEAAAAKEMLDESFGILDAQDPSDSNTYTLGRIGNHHVVIACLPGGKYGTTSATTVTNNMVRTFSKSLRIGLIVGVGGGIPSSAYDIRLSDVMISFPEGTSSGVLQYDIGKVGTKGEFHRTGSLNSPPKALLTASNLIRAAELTDNPRYPEYLLKTIARTARTRKNFDRPQQDRLFKLKHVHPTTASTCDGCLAVWEETRSERETTDPQSHYGIIASGNAVIKDGYTREQLRLNTGALCFEMEAAGLMMDFPCIVVRGICDYADTHKNKQWQGYAALAAASYAKELLGYIPTTHVSQENLVVDICSSLKEEIEGTNKRLDRAYDQQEQYHNEQKTRALTDQQQRCHQVFKVTNYEEQKNINPQRVEGTCQWALQSPEYNRWWESRCNDLLWVSADPGCGKSVLARSIIDDQAKASSLGVTICFFFFKENDNQNRLDTALCSEKNGEKLQQEADKLWRIFTEAVSADVSHKTVCIFDTLDECREKDQGRLIEKLQFFYRQTSLLTKDTCLKFLVTSRPYDHIQDHFRAITNSFPHIHIRGEEENDRINKEIDLVVKVRVKELAEVAQLSPEVHRRVEQQLLKMKHRTYLWLHLAIDNIRTAFKHSLRPTQISITLIPPSVNAAYEKILGRVPADQQETARKILEIIVAARRPLTIREMAMALGIATCPESRTTIQAGLDPIHLDRKLRQLCGLFIFINNSKIYLIHQTARDFLIRKGKEMAIQSNFEWRCNLEDMNCQMAAICLRYLFMENSEHSGAHVHSSIGGFLEYSAIHWPDHIRDMTSTPEQEVEDMLFQLYDISTNLFFLWFPIFWRAVESTREIPTMTSIHLAAYNGHTQVLHRLLATGESNINSADSTGSTAVMYASLNGHHEAVQQILSHGADVNIRNRKSSNVLYAACSRGYYEIVQMLLEHGADANAMGEANGYALQAASAKGYDKIVQILIEYGADVNSYGGHCCNPLFAAYYYGHFSTMRILLKHGADVNVRRQYYGNTLQAICGAGDVKTMRMLLEHGASLVCQGDEHYANVLCVACFEGRADIAHVLLEFGAGVNAPVDSYINSFLYDWYNAEVSVQVDSYGNSLLAACSRGHKEIVQMLLQYGADITVQGKDEFHGNALEVACHEGHDNIVQLLLDHGADANAQGGFYGNALQSACSEGHGHIVQILLEHGADVNAQGGHYGNALRAASTRGNEKIVLMLQDYVADVNA
ncbi:unnamed protein product [Penicillium discolor]